MTDAEKLLHEARKIILASTLSRGLHKDWLQRSADYFKKRRPEPRTPTSHPSTGEPR